MAPGPSLSNVSPEHVHRLAHAVLGRPEFQPAQPSLLQRGLAAVVRFIAHLLSRLSAGGVGNYISLAAAILVVVVIVGLIVMAARTARRSARRLPRIESRQARPVTGAEWRAQAQIHEAVGAWREALRCRYRALVADLALAGLVEEVPGRTAGEYRHQLATAMPAGAVAFGTVTDLFESSWYGGGSTGPDETARAASLSDTVLVGARRAHSREEPEPGSPQRPDRLSDGS